MFKLIIEDDEGKTTVVPLIREEITIGRKEGNTIRLTERNVSRRHAKLTRGNGSIFIEDLESYNGIKVNGSRVAGRIAVFEGDRIQIGDYLLGLKVEGDTDVRAHRPTLRESPDGNVAFDVKQPEGRAATNDGVTEPDTAVGKIASALLRDVARLVCVSSNFAGLEAVLSKAVMVIGRTSDNDIVINHRSVSRHHAQIVEEGGRYTVMDMQSANGVRVNGEEYGKVELRRGDLIDLGHVRLRFVAPGEKFDFATDATIYDMGHSERRRSGAWLALALVAAAGGAVIAHQIYTHQRAGRTTPPPTTRPADPATGQQPSGDGTGELLHQIDAALSTQAWDRALERCTQLTGEEKAKAEESCKRAEEEKQAKSAYDAALAAATTNEYAKALELFTRIPATSVYYPEIQQSKRYELARQSYEAQALTELEQLKARGRCQQAEQLLARIKQLLPSSKIAETTLDDCGTAVATARTRSRAGDRTQAEGGHTRASATRQTRSSAETPNRTPATKTPAKSATQPSAEQVQQARVLLDQAWKAYREGAYTQAQTLAERVNKIAPSQQAISIMGASACYLKRRTQAKAAFDKLDAQRQQLLRRVCERMGVNLE